MKKTIAVILVLSAMICRAQLTAESVVGSHAGMLTWEKELCTLELTANSGYVIQTFDKVSLEPITSIRGRWRLEGDKVILTDIIGNETTLCRSGDQWYITGRNGYSCLARFEHKKDLKTYWTGQRNKGC